MKSIAIVYAFVTLAAFVTYVCYLDNKSDKQLSVNERYTTSEAQK